MKERKTEIKKERKKETNKERKKNKTNRKWLRQKSVKKENIFAVTFLVEQSVSPK